MISMIKETGIFLLIAQALLYCLPKEAYAKYVRVIVGILMIAGIMRPLLSLDMEEILTLPSDFSIPETETETENSDDLWLSSLETELLQKLKDNPAKGYLVESVSLQENGEKLVLLVKEQGASDSGTVKIENIRIGGQEESSEAWEKETEALKDHYAAVLGISAEQISISLK